MFLFWILYCLQVVCNLSTRMDLLSDLENILASDVDFNMSETILKNLQRPENRDAALALFGHVPTSIRELATCIGIYLLFQEPLHNY